MFSCIFLFQEEDSIFFISNTLLTYEMHRTNVNRANHYKMMGPIISTLNCFKMDLMEQGVD